MALDNDPTTPRGQREPATSTADGERCWACNGHERGGPSTVRVVCPICKGHGFLKEPLTEEATDA